MDGIRTVLVLAIIFNLDLIAFNAGRVHAQEAIVNRKVERIIDISTQLVTITCRITVDNNSKSTLSSYQITFDDNHRAHLSHIAASIASGTGGDKVKNPVQVVKQGDHAWRVELGNEYRVSPGATSPVIEVEAVFTHLLSPYPTQILQSERQLVMYIGNHYFMSPYPTKTQTTKVKLASSGTIESFSKLKPTSQSDHAINYGPYENVEPKAFSRMQIHSENNSPFLTVAKLERTIELSHWAGMISVEEVIDVVHTGATLKGPFSRYEFQREPTNGISAVKSFKTKLPGTAQDVYYRDDIGNISTSNLRYGTQYVTAELRPRFPLFGGWKTHYLLGYYVPTQDYLFSEGNQFMLKMLFIDHVFDNYVIDEATVKVVLPEGSTDIKLRLPYSTVRDRDQIHHTYLDTIGRPVITLHKSNLVEQHIQYFEVHYNYNRLWLLQEPLLIVMALFLLCILVIVYVRLDFSLTKNPIKESVIKVAGMMERILKHNEKRMALYASYDQAAAKYKASKDKGSYQMVLKRLNGEHKQETQATSDLISKLKHDGANSDILDKVNELQRLDRALKDLLHQQSNLVEKLVPGYMSKQLYIDADAGITKKKEEIVEKMTAITNSL